MRPTIYPVVVVVMCGHGCVDVVFDIVDAAAGFDVPFRAAWCDP
jgi:hypothetical protein